MIDTSAYTARRYPPELVKYMGSHGRMKVMFGTNYPMITASKALEHLDDLGLDEDPAVQALNNVVRNDAHANEVRASALDALGWAEQIRLEKSDIYSMITTVDTPLARSAASHYVHPDCAIPEDGPGPDAAFELRLRALFTDHKELVRYAAATCFLADGAW